MLEKKHSLNIILLMKKILLALTLFSFIITDCSSQENIRIIRLTDYNAVTFKNLINDISDSQVIFIGELHSEKSHHQFQLSVIEALNNNRKSLAIGLEMFREIDQKILDDWVAGRLDDNSFIRSFYDNWGINWGLYKDIFLFAKKNNIPLIGLNVPKEITKKVGKSGFESLTREELKNLPPNVTCQIDRRYMELLKLVFQHKNENNKEFNNFCEAQVLWDQAMAYYLDRYLKSKKDVTVVVLAGTIHSWKYGIPKQLEKFGRYKITSIVQDNPFYSNKDVTIDEADYMVLHRKSN